MSPSKQRYIQFCKDQKEQLNLFFQPYWLDAVSGVNGWDVIINEKDSQLKAVMPFALRKKAVGKIISNPALTPHLGIHFVYPKNQEKEERKIAFENKIAKELIASLPKYFYYNLSFHPGFKNWLGFYWEGFKQTTRYTYIIPGTLSVQDAYDNVKSKTKNIIRKAEGSLRVEETEVNTFWELNKQTFARQNMKMPYSKELIINLSKALEERKQVKFVKAVDADNITHAAVMLVNDFKTTYCIAIGSDEKYRNSGAIPLLLWKGIVSTLKEGRSFDFEGSMMPNVEPVFRNFGGMQTPFFRIYKSANKVTDALLSLMGKW